MVMKGDLTWRGEHTVQYADDVLQNCTPDTYKILFIFLKIYLFLDRGEGWERNINVGASRMTPNGDLARNPGMYPDWESNWGPLGLQVSTQFTE